MIPGFCHEVDENCTLLGYYAESSGNFLLTFWDNLSVPTLGVKNPKDLLDSYQCFSTTYQFHLQGSRSFGFLTPEGRTDRLS
jgi:hypothetical protein